MRATLRAGAVQRWAGCGAAAAARRAGGSGAAGPGAASGAGSGALVPEMDVICVLGLDLLERGLEFLGLRLGRGD